MIKTFCVLVLAALLGGCAAQAQEPAAPQPPAQSSPSPAITATTRQYASLINPQLRDFRKTWDEYSVTCPFDGPSPVCTARMMTIDLIGQTLVLELVGATTTDTAAFIGEPPAEITDLVRETLNAAHNMDNAVSEDGVESTPGAVSRAGFALDSICDRWEPYM